MDSKQPPARGIYAAFAPPRSAMREFSPFRRVLRLQRKLDEAQALADAVELRAEFDQAWQRERETCLGGLLAPRDPRDVLRELFQDIADETARGTDATNA